MVVEAGFLKDYESKMVLYNYDAFLFDFNYKKDGLKYLKDVKEFYLGVGGEGRKNFRDVKNYRRRKRWL